MIDAKRDVEKEREALRALKEQYSHSGNTAKSAEEGGEVDDAENAQQDSVSEDDSDDDSDRKGTFKHMVVSYCSIYNIYNYNNVIMLSSRNM